MDERLRTRLPSSVLGLLLLCLTALAMSMTARAEAPRSVLVISETDPDSSFLATLHAALIRERAQSQAHVALFTVPASYAASHAEPDTSADSASTVLLEQSLLQRLSVQSSLAESFDEVITLGAAPMRFVTLSANLFADLEHSAFHVDHAPPPARRYSQPIDAPALLRAINTLFPATARVVLYGSETTKNDYTSLSFVFESAWQEMFRDVFSFEVRSLSDEHRNPVEDAQALPPNSVIIYIPSSDGSLAQSDFHAWLRTQRQFPVFVTSEREGLSVSVAVSPERLAQAVMRKASGVTDMPKNQSVSQTVVNYDVLQRWSIDSARLPADIHIVGQPAVDAADTGVSIPQRWFWAWIALTLSAVVWGGWSRRAKSRRQAGHGNTPDAAVDRASTHHASTHHASTHHASTDRAPADRIWDGAADDGSGRVSHRVSHRVSDSTSDSASDSPRESTDIANQGSYVAAMPATDLDMTSHPPSPRQLTLMSKVGRWRWDPQQDQFFVDHVLASVFGVDDDATNGDVLLDDWRSHIHEADKAILQDFLDCVRAGMQPSDENIAIERPDGSLRQLEIVETRVDTDELGRTIHVCGLAHDISELHHLRERVLERDKEVQALNTRIKAFAESTDVALELLGIGLLRWDFRRGVVVASRRACEILSRPDLTNVPQEEPMWWLDTVHPEDAQALKEQTLQAFNGNGRLSMEFRVYSPSGAIRWIRATANVIHDIEGHPDVAVASIELYNRRPG